MPHRPAGARLPAGVAAGRPRPRGRRDRPRDRQRGPRPRRRATRSSSASRRAARCIRCRTGRSAYCDSIAALKFRCARPDGSVATTDARRPAGRRPLLRAVVVRHAGGRLRPQRGQGARRRRPAHRRPAGLRRADRRRHRARRPARAAPARRSRSSAPARSGCARSWRRGWPVRRRSSRSTAAPRGSQLAAEFGATHLVSPAPTSTRSRRSATPPAAAAWSSRSRRPACPRCSPRRCGRWTRWAPAPTSAPRAPGELGGIPMLEAMTKGLTVRGVLQGDSTPAAHHPAAVGPAPARAAALRPADHALPAGRDQPGGRGHRDRRRRQARPADVLTAASAARHGASANEPDRSSRGAPAFAGRGAELVPVTDRPPPPCEPVRAGSGRCRVRATGDARPAHGYRRRVGPVSLSTVSEGGTSTIRERRPGAHVYLYVADADGAALNAEWTASGRAEGRFTEPGNPAREYGLGDARAVRRAPDGDPARGSVSAR